MIGCDEAIAAIPPPDSLVIKDQAKYGKILFVSIESNKRFKK